MSRHMPQSRRNKREAREKETEIQKVKFPFIFVNNDFLIKNNLAIRAKQGQVDCNTEINSAF